MNSVNCRFKTECQLIAVMASMLMFLNSCAVSKNDNQFACEGPRTTVVKNVSADGAKDGNINKPSAVELLKEGERILNSSH